jgi:hypothetical protein
MLEGTRHAEVICIWVADALQIQGATVRRDPGTMLFPRWESRAWFCPSCGEVWAREMMLDPHPLQFRAIESSCARCGPVPQYVGFAGSLTWPTRDPLDTFDSLPPALQRREADILLEQTTRP